MTKMKPKPKNKKYGSDFTVSLPYFWLHIYKSSVKLIVV